MSALSADRRTDRIGSEGKTFHLGVDGGSHIYKGAIVCRDASGNAVPGAATSTLKAIGRSVGNYDNTNGSNGDITAQIESGVFKYANGDTIAAADVPCIVYVVDDQTVAKSSAGSTRPVAGVAIQVDTDGVRVAISPEMSTQLGSTAGVTLGIASKAVGFAALTDADTQQTVDFDAALPAGAVVLGTGANVSAIFDNAGDTASLTFDFGIKSGDTDVWIDGGSLNAVAKVYGPAGVAPVGLVGAVTPSVIIDSSVNLNTLTKGAATFYLIYGLAF